MLQRLPIALAQVKAGNISENLLNEIKPIRYSLYWAKEITKKSMYQCNEFNKCIIQKCILYLWILKIVSHQILIDYYSILQTK